MKKIILLFILGIISLSSHAKSSVENIHSYLNSLEGVNIVDLKENKSEYNGKYYFYECDAKNIVKSVAKNLLDKTGTTVDFKEGSSCEYSRLNSPIKILVNLKGSAVNFECDNAGFRGELLCVLTPIDMLHID